VHDQKSELVIQRALVFHGVSRGDAGQITMSPTSWGIPQGGSPGPLPPASGPARGFGLVVDRKTQDSVEPSLP